MRIEQLRQFIAVAQIGNFRKASKELGISQPALTRSIQSLEQYFGVSLLDRLPGGVTLTDYGKVVMEWAQDTVTASLNIKRYVDLLSDATSGSIVIGTGTYFADYVLASAITKIVNKYPTLNIKVIRDTGKNAENMILNRQIDLFLGWMDEKLKTGEIQTERFETGPIALFCRKEHPLLRIHEPDLQVILKYPFVGPVIPDEMKENVNNIRRKITGEDRPLIDIEFDSYTEIRKIVEQSNCVGGLPESSLLSFFKEGMFERISVDLPGLVAPGGISYLKGRTLLPVTKELIEELMLILEERSIEPEIGAKG